MEVWIEQVLFDNIIINFLILFCTVKLLKLECGKLRIFFSAFLGACFSLTFPLIVMPAFLFVFVKLLVGVVLILLLFKQKQKFKNYLITFITFLFLTFLFGGACYGIILMLNATFLGINNGIVYNYDFPISLIVLICFLMFYLLLNLFAQFYRKKQINNFIYKIVFVNNNKSICTTAFFDSGNKLIDDKTQKAIIIISLNLSQKIFEKINIVNLISGNLANEMRFKEIITASKKQKILIKDVEKVEIFIDDKPHIYTNVPLGLMLKNFNDSIDYDALIGANYVV